MQFGRRGRLGAAPGTAPGHQPPQGSALWHLLAAQYGPSPRPKTAPHSASVRPQKTAKAQDFSRLMARAEAAAPSRGPAVFPVRQKTADPTNFRFFRPSGIADNIGCASPTAWNRAQNRVHHWHRSTHPKSVGGRPKCPTSQTDRHAHRFSAPLQGLSVEPPRETRHTPRHSHNREHAPSPRVQNAHSAPRMSRCRSAHYWR